MDGLDAATDKRPGVATAAYELAAVVWQVHDGVGSAPQAAAEPLDEHVVAHVKVRNILETIRHSCFATKQLVSLAVPSADRRAVFGVSQQSNEGTI